MDAENSSEEVQIKQERDGSEDDDDFVVTYKSPLNNNNSKNSSGPKKRKKLTAKEREKAFAEKRPKREEEQLKKDEKKRQRDEEREAKRQQKEQERLKREEEQRIKKAEIDRKKKEKEVKRRKKEEERLKKAEERDKIQQQKQEVKEEKERLKRIKDEKILAEQKRFKGFFIQQNKQNDLSLYDDETRSLDGNNQNHLAFNPAMFQVKKNMVVAPILRRPPMTFAEHEYLDRFGFCSPSSSSSLMTTNNYLIELKKKKNKGRRSGRTEMSNMDDIIAQLMSNKIIKNPKAQGLVKWRYKLLQFEDNQRPPYWGTWKKESFVVKPRNPWGQEKDIDYEFDSDDEWGEDDDKDAEYLPSDKEEEDDDADSVEYEDDWMVPHGYMSDGEGTQDRPLDKDALKLQEKSYFEQLQQKHQFQPPEIRTERLSDFKLIFCPLMKERKTSSPAPGDNDKLPMFEKLDPLSDLD